MLDKEIKNIVLVIAIITASLFTYGLTFHQGYLSYWGVEETMFKLSFERTLFQGFVATSYLGAITVVPVFLVSVTCLFFVLIFEKIYAKCKKYHWFNKLKETNKNQTKISKNLKYAGWFVIFTYWAFVAIIIILFLLIVAGYLGRETAESQHEKFKNGDITPVQISHAKYGKMKGFPLLCSENQCAFFINSEVIIFRTSQITKITSKPGKA